MILVSKEKLNSNFVPDPNREGVVIRPKYPKANNPIKIKKKMILYIHGFRSKGNGEKAKALQTYFPDENVISPSLETKPFQDMNYLMELTKFHLKKNERVIVIGTSLGGFYAHYLSRALGIPCVLINPSFNPSESLENSLGINTIYGSEKFGDNTIQTLNLKREHLDEFNELEKHLITNDSPFTISDPLINLFISVDDDVINHAETLVKFAGCNIKLFDNAGHIFSKFDEILPDVKTILEK